MTQQVLVDKHQFSIPSPKDTIGDDDKIEIIAENITNPFVPIEDEPSRAESPVKHNNHVNAVEENIPLVQEQNENKLASLQTEINRLQQENRGLHCKLVNIHSLSSSEQEQKSRNELISQNSSDMQQRIQQLESQLIESQTTINSLMQTIHELNRKSSSKIDLLSVNDAKILTEVVDLDNQHFTKTADEKRHDRRYIQEITKLRAALLEILNTERLGKRSMALARDCLKSTNLSETFSTKSPAPSLDENLAVNGIRPARSNTALSATGKSQSFRHELPIQHINLTPPEVTMRKSSTHHRSPDQRISLPPLISGVDMKDMLNTLSHPDNYIQQQHLIKVGETSIARRERRTHELQRIRLNKNLYH